jgi:hypothetical protein
MDRNSSGLAAGGATFRTVEATYDYTGESGTQDRDGWRDPGWAKAARDYHRARAGRRSVVEIDPERLGRLRRLLGDDISVDRAWRELNEAGGRPAPQSTADALLYQLRTHGLAAFHDPSCRCRLADLSVEQLREVMAALIRVRARFTGVTDELLIALDRIRRS